MFPSAFLDEGSSADRQQATYRQTGDRNAVMDRLIAETAERVLDELVAPPLNPSALAEHPDE